jgi:hypothetical protein
MVQLIAFVWANDDFHHGIANEPSTTSTASFHDTFSKSQRHRF